MFRCVRLFSVLLGLGRAPVVSSGHFWCVCRLLVLLGGRRPSPAPQVSPCLTSCLSVLANAQADFSAPCLIHAGGAGGK